ncbi:MAG: hypothetical protein K0B15_14760 [Lentimicrobium sp.]|nr:hypothetical protein [Lentimicrobium sp.]
MKNSLKFLIFFGLIVNFVPLQLNAQISGCTDPQANNYNSEATLNDGSCVYLQTSINLETVVNILPSIINETSGLIYWNGGLWTHNDSGNLPEIYKIDTITGQVLQTVTLAGVTNIDWEDIAQDDTRIYIGDFGNNLGNRTDLKVYSIPKSKIPDEGDTEIQSEIINFGYGDQQTFERLNRNNDFDSESLFVLGDSLYLLTKNWVNLKTRLYSLPKSPGTYVVYPKDSLMADGLITGADVLEDGEIILIGYKNYKPFIWLLFDFEGDNFFGGNKRRIDFKGDLGKQTEGIAYTFGNNVFISSERSSVNAAKLFKINTRQWTFKALPGIEDMVEPAANTE